MCLFFDDVSRDCPKPRSDISQHRLDIEIIVGKKTTKQAHNLKKCGKRDANEGKIFFEVRVEQMLVEGNLIVQRFA